MSEDAPPSADERERARRSEPPKRADVWESYGASFGGPEERASWVGPEPRRPVDSRRWDDPMFRARLWTLLLLLALNLVHVAQLYAPSTLPRLFRSPLWLPLLSCLVFYLVVHSFTHAMRSLVFYGRFIRPGLKRLLEQKRRSLFGDEKLFRGRKTVIMKLDMANYTKTTFEMPYGMRRLFQDLWFTLIDQVVADKVFLDKSLGDGSVYCFEDKLSEGCCTAALRAAFEIRDRQVRRFDEIYRERLRASMAAIEELRIPAERYLREFAAKQGRSFWDARTLVRAALVAGYVDEGLWGLISQSHYDVQGPPVVLATRLEDLARNGEIVVDRRFVEELEAESPGLLDPSVLEQRTVELKGIGSWDIYVLPPEMSLAPVPEPSA